MRYSPFEFLVQNSEGHAEEEKAEDAVKAVCKGLQRGQKDFKVPSLRSVEPRKCFGNRCRGKDSGQSYGFSHGFHFVFTSTSSVSMAEKAELRWW